MWEPWTTNSMAKVVGYLLYNNVTISGKTLPFTQYKTLLGFGLSGYIRVIQTSEKLTRLPFIQMNNDITWLFDVWVHQDSSERPIQSSDAQRWICICANICPVHYPRDGINCKTVWHLRGKVMKEDNVQSNITKCICNKFRKKHYVNVKYFPDVRVYKLQLIYVI